MNIPWKLKSRAFRILSYMPGRALYFAQRHITRRSKVQITEIHIGWKHHAEIIAQTGAQSLIEFGAGKTLAQNLYLSTMVKEQTVVDLFAMLELPMLNEAIVQLAALGVPLDGRPVNSLKDLQDIYGIRYIAPFDMRNSGFPDDSFDICVSTNTLEHIPAADITAIFHELFRVLRPGGHVSAMIDYSDHYAHSDPSLSRLHYLQFNARDWAAHNHSNHYQNRMRHNHHGAIFRETGFDITDALPTDYADPAGLRLLPELLTGDTTDHATTGFWKLTVPVS